MAFRSELVRDGKGGYVPYPFFQPQATVDLIHECFVPRPEDVLLVTYTKAGTTWLRQIMHLLTHGGEQGEQTIQETMPYLENPVDLEGHLTRLAQTPGRRYLTSHFAYAMMPGMPHSPAKTIYLARNPKDCTVSYFYHAVGATVIAFDGSWDDFFQLMVTGQIWRGSVFDHVVDWWQASRDNSNILFLKYEDLQKDLRRVVAQIAEFIELPTTAALVDAVTAQCHFQVMAANDKVNMEKRLTRRPEHPYRHLRKGIVGDWRNHFTPEQNAIFDDLYLQRMVAVGLEFDFDLPAGTRSNHSSW